MTYQQWAEAHASIFGLISIEEIKMILSWQAIFSMCGYSIEELQEATSYLASGHSPKYRTEHLQAIHDRIKKQRQEEAERQREAELKNIPDHVGTCVLCSNSGSVIVPHPSVWQSPDPNYWRTCSLWCICGVGRSKKLNMQEYEKAKFEWKKDRITTLDEYEASFDRNHWQELMIRHQELIRERFHVDMKTREIDQILGTIAAKGIH